MDKTPLEDERLDLNADHVHPLEMPESIARSYIEGDCSMEEVDDFDSTFEAALDYVALEGKDAVIVITIKAGK